MKYYHALGLISAAALALCIAGCADRPSTYRHPLAPVVRPDAYLHREAGDYLLVLLNEELLPDVKVGYKGSTRTLYPDISMATQFPYRVDLAYTAGTIVKKSYHFTMEKDAASGVWRITGAQQEDRSGNKIREIGDLPSEEQQLDANRTMDELRRHGVLPPNRKMD